MKPLLLLIATLTAVTAGCTDRENMAATGSVAVTGSAHVIDGDTVDLASDDNGARVRVRLLGVDAPEVAHGQQPAQCGAEQARQRLVGLLHQRQVQVVPDAVVDATDRYGRRLAYLEVDGRDVGEQLLDEGLVAAWKPASSPAPARWSTYVSADHLAQQSRRGSWATCGSVGR